MMMWGGGGGKIPPQNDARIYGPWRIFSSSFISVIRAGSRFFNNLFNESINKLRVHQYKI